MFPFWMWNSAAFSLRDSSLGAFGFDFFEFVGKREDAYVKCKKERKKYVRCKDVNKFIFPKSCIVICHDERLDLT